MRHNDVGTFSCRQCPGGDCDILTHTMACTQRGRRELAAILGVRASSVDALPCEGACLFVIISFQAPLCSLAMNQLYIAIARQRTTHGDRTLCCNTSHARHTQRASHGHTLTAPSPSRSQLSPCIQVIQSSMHGTCTPFYSC
jgi:hypothetical protein